MSYMRDIQKLRQTRGPNQQYNGYGANTRFSQPNQATQSSQYSHPTQITQNNNNPDVYNINYEKFMEPDSRRNSNRKFNQTYGKIISSKQIYAKSKERRVHKRGQSNGVIYQPKKQMDLISSGLSIYNFSMKLGNKPSGYPNPLTARKQKPESTDYQMMPQTQQTSRTNIQNKIGKISQTSSTTGTVATKRMSQQQYSQQLENKLTQTTKSSFKILYPIGKGGFGKVWKIQHKKTNQILAMKEMYKAKIINKKSINSVMNQRNLLAKLKHPFIINMHHAFQDRENLYLIMDYLDGGDLRYHIGKRRRFTQSQTKFFIANMVIGLEYMHNHQIIHRDMKPENIVFDSDGYLRITDMGISREFREDNHQDTSGTPGYMSPQVICRNNHSYPADYFAVGVMAYQFMLGKRPYNGRNRKQIRDQIISKQAMIKPEDVPNKWSPQAADFINKMIQRNPKSRLGYNGLFQIKSHTWLRGIDWQRLLLKQIRAPYIPISIEQNYDEYKQQISEDTIDDNLEENLLMLRDQEVQNLFEGYYCQTAKDPKGLANESPQLFTK